MSHIITDLMADVTRFEYYKKTSDKILTQQLLNRISQVSSKDVNIKANIDRDVIKLASDISNMEILLSEDGQSFTLSNLRTQPDYGVAEVTWLVNKLKTSIKDKNLRKAISHLITGSAVTRNREIFLDVMRASIFIVDYIDSVVNLIGYAIAFRCKSVYELSDLFNFHIIEQDYSSANLSWFYNNTQNVQKRVI